MYSIPIPRRFYRLSQPRITNLNFHGPHLEGTCRVPWIPRRVAISILDVRWRRSVVARKFPNYGKLPPITGRHAISSERADRMEGRSAESMDRARPASFQTVGIDWFSSRLRRIRCSRSIKVSVARPRTRTTERRRWSI